MFGLAVNRCPSVMTSLIMGLVFVVVAEIGTGSSLPEDAISSADFQVAQLSPVAEDEPSAVDLSKRMPSFRLGKRLVLNGDGIITDVDSDFRPDVVRRAPSFRLGKRPSASGNLVYYRRSPSFRLGKRSDVTDDLVLHKRAPTFRLGKRTIYDDVNDEMTSYDKRAPSFRLGK